MREAPLRHDGAAAADDAVTRFAGAGMNGSRTPAWMVKFVDALLALLDEGVAVELSQSAPRAGRRPSRAPGRSARCRSAPARSADDPLARRVDVAPGDRSITVSAPQRIAHTIFSTSSAIEEATAELPILALTFTRKFRPMIIGWTRGG